MNLCMACYPAPKEDLDPSEESGVGLKKELVYKSS